MSKKVVLAFSGGLDTSYCATYLSQEQGYEVHAVTVNTGGFDEEERGRLEQRALDLGVANYAFLDKTDSFYREGVKFLLFGNVLKNNTYPLSVSAERVFQAVAIADYANEIGADAIDQYVMRGGKLIVYVDPVSEVGVAFRQSAQQRGAQAAPPRSELDTLLSAWGVKVDDDSVVGDLALAQQVNGGTPGNPRLVRYLPWLELGPANYNRDDVLMADLGPMMFASAAPMTAVEGAGTTFTPLIATTNQTMLFKAEELVYGASPVRLLEKFKPEDKAHVLAARLTGSAKSAFPDGPLAEPAPEVGHGLPGGNDKKAEEKKAPEKPPVPDSHLAASDGSINVIVVGESDNLFDQFWVQAQEFFGERVLVPTTSNGDFLINALDNLAGSKDLISLRSRGKSTRPFEVVEGLRRDAEQRFLAEERDLTAKLEESQKRIVELRGKAAGEGGALLSEQQQEEIAKAQEEVLNTRRQLRDVQRSLNKDIEALETQVKAVNIAGIPAVVAVVALVLAFARYQRRRRRAQG